MPIVVWNKFNSAFQIVPDSMKYISKAFWILDDITLHLALPVINIETCWLGNKVAKSLTKENFNTMNNYKLRASKLVVQAL